MRNAVLMSLVATTLLITGVFTSTVRADDAPSDSILVIAVDSLAVSSSAQDAIVASSVTELATAVPDTARVALIGFGKTASQPRLFEVNTPDLAMALETFVSNVTVAGTAGESDQFLALATIFNFLGGQSAGPESRVLFMTAGGSAGDEAGEQQRVSTMSSFFATEDWVIDVAMLPSATAAARDYLVNVAASTGGQSYDIGAIDGMSRFTDNLLGVDSEPVIQTDLARGASALAPIDVPALTDKLTLTVTRRSSATLVSLFDPRGAPIVEIRPDTSVVETESAMVITVDNPAAGKWTVQALGDQSEVFAGVDVSNPLAIGLVDSRPLAVGSEALITVRATNNGEPVTLEGAYVEATISTNSAASVYRLNDDGAGADVSAGDGLFSVLIPEVTTQATSEITMALKWHNLDSEILATDQIHAEHFPVVRFVPIEATPVDRNEFTKVGRLEITRSDFAHPVVASDLSAIAVSPLDVIAPVRFEPINQLSDGSAWQWDIFAAPSTTGEYEVTAALDIEYLGRAIRSTSAVMPVGLGVFVPPPVVVPVELMSTQRVPIWAWTLLGFAATLIVGLGVYKMKTSGQPIPYGYLYDDRGKLVVNFRRIRLGFLASRFNRNRIPGEMVPGIPLNDVQFVFWPDRVEMNTSSETPALRVNGRPPDKRVELRNDMTLGIGGRLLTYMRHRQIPGIAPGAAD